MPYSNCISRGLRFGDILKPRPPDACSSRSKAPCQPKMQKRESIQSWPGGPLFRSGGPFLRGDGDVQLDKNWWKARFHARNAILSLFWLMIPASWHYDCRNKAGRAISRPAVLRGSWQVSVGWGFAVLLAVLGQVGLPGYRPTRPMSRRSFALDQQHDLPSSSDSSAYNSSVLLHTAQCFHIRVQGFRSAQSLTNQIEMGFTKLIQKSGLDNSWNHAKCAEL